MSLTAKRFTARCQGGVDDVGQEIEEINSDGPGVGEVRKKLSPLMGIFLGLH